MAEIYQLPENGNNNGTIPFSIPIGMVPCGSEDAAWLQGYIMREVTRILDR